MKHSLEKYLEDVRLSIEDIERYTKNIENTLQLEGNQMLFDAVCRRFAIIGEAIYQADKTDATLNISNKKKIKGLRHIIVHDYDLVRPADLFIIISKHLPILKQEVLVLLNNFEENNK